MNEQTTPNEHIMAPQTSAGTLERTPSTSSADKLTKDYEFIESKASEEKLEKEEDWSEWE